MRNGMPRHSEVETLSAGASAPQPAPVHGAKGRLGAIVPANNSVIEPELWSVLPPDVALYTTRILARGELTPAAVRRMEEQVDRAVEEIAATGVDVITYCDMVTTFIMEPGWNEAKVEAISRHTGVAALSAWTALRDALAALGIRRFALGTPYPRALHALARPFFAARGFEIVDDATLDIVQMTDVPKTGTDRLLSFVRGLNAAAADAIVLLATDLPTFGAIAQIERERSIPVLTSNQTILWRTLRAVGNPARIASLGRLLDA
jgi:maleate cis-trans isomerase